MALKDIFKKQKTIPENLNVKTNVIHEIVELARERSELKSKLDDLRNDVLAEIKKEVDNIVKEIEIVKQAIEVNDRKLDDYVMILEDEINVEESGIYR